MTINVSDLESAGSNIIQAVIEHEGIINMVASSVGILPEVALAEKLLPLAAGALQFMQQESGKNLTGVFQDLVSHLTPGQPNAPVLGPAQGSGA